MEMNMTQSYHKNVEQDFKQTSLLSYFTLKTYKFVKIEYLESCK